MATEFWYRNAGTWLKAKEVWYRNAGTWLKAKEVWYRQGGVWRKVFSGLTLGASWAAALYNTSSASTGTRRVRMVFNTDGTSTWDFTNAAGTAGTFVQNWAAVDAAVGAQVWIKVTAPAGGNAAFAGTMTSGTWYSLATQQTFQIYNSPSSTETTGTGTVSFSSAGSDATILLSGDFTWYIGYTP